LPFRPEIHSNTILAHAQSRDMETALGIWALQSSANALPDAGELRAMLGDVVQDYFMCATVSGHAFEVLYVGKRLGQLTSAFVVDQHSDSMPEHLADPIGTLFSKTHTLRQPLYSTHYSRRSKLVHRWEILAMPVLLDGGPGIVSLMIPLEFHHDVLLAMVETNPVGFCAAEVVRDPYGKARDFGIYLANDAACDAIGKSREEILHSRISRTIPAIFEDDGFDRLQQVADTLVTDFFEYSRRSGADQRTFGITASSRGSSLVLAFTEISDLMEARRQLTAQHEAALATNAELTRQKEDLHATAESLEIARQALSAEVQRRATLESRLRHLAETDSLTSLANRRHFIDLAQAEMRRAERYGGTFALAMLDIDHFKAVNDSLGHAAGDKGIVAVAEVCVQTCRTDVDVVGRIGGEEFAVLLPATDLQGAADLAERIRKEIAALHIGYESTLIDLTVSVGVAEFGAGDADINDVLNRADKALYVAKNGGRNRVEHLAA